VFAVRKDSRWIAFGIHVSKLSNLQIERLEMMKKLSLLPLMLFPQAGFLISFRPFLLLIALVFLVTNCCCLKLATHTTNPQSLLAITLS